MAYPCRYILLSGFLACNGFAGVADYLQAIGVVFMRAEGFLPLVPSIVGMGCPCLPRPTLNALLEQLLVVVPDNWPCHDITPV